MIQVQKYVDLERELIAIQKQVREKRITTVSLEDYEKSYKESMENGTGFLIDENIEYSQYIESKDLKKIRIHDLRHSHASLLINQGEDYLVVKERLGHASITTTIDTYSHLYPSKQKTLANKLDDLF